ncbi:uncharacterized protein LOC114677402 isoform X2 [Macaca mulatta]
MARNLTPAKDKVVHIVSEIGSCCVAQGDLKVLSSSNSPASASQSARIIRFLMLLPKAAHLTLIYYAAFEILSIPLNTKGKARTRKYGCTKKGLTVILLLRLEYSSVIMAHRRVEFLGFSDPPA